MPTDAELRTLFRDASAPESRIDTAAVIRRSRRRRLPQRVGAGGVLTLAIAGIGVAGISGLQAIAPRTASDLADAPTAVSEGSPFSGSDSRVADASCEAGAPDATIADDITVAPRFPATAAPGQPVAGSLVLANSGTVVVAATVADAGVALSRDGAQEWHSDGLLVGTTVSLEPGESVELAFRFTAVQCTATVEPLMPGDYEVTAFVTLVPDTGAVEVVGGPASVITVR